MKPLSGTHNQAGALQLSATDLLCSQVITFIHTSDQCQTKVPRALQCSKGSETPCTAEAGHSLVLLGLMCKIRGRASGLQRSLAGDNLLHFWGQGARLQHCLQLPLTDIPQGSPFLLTPLPDMFCFPTRGFTRGLGGHSLAAQGQPPLVAHALHRVVAGGQLG